MQSRTIEVLEVTRVRATARSGTEAAAHDAPAEEEHAAQLA
jgi:hypothetical protein